MKSLSKPILITLVFGVIGGLFFVPLALGFSRVMSATTAFALTIWIYLAIYGVLLLKGCGKKITSIVFPLLLMPLSIFWIDSVSTILVIAAGTFSWIRSGICFPDRFTQRFIAEIVLCAGGVILVAGFAPLSLLNWAIAVWMFALIQALYFVIFENSSKGGHRLDQDPFETAREQAENILAAGL